MTTVNVSADLIDRVHALGVRIRPRLQQLGGPDGNEEATKTALVLPFINFVLGYNPFEPSEVAPEYSADILGKKNEKVDYAILKDGKPVILIECKKYGTPLERAQASQLYRYMSATEARIAVLTDGVSYQFYTDLDQPNRMDEKPFLEFNLLDPEEEAQRNSRSP